MTIKELINQLSQHPNQDAEINLKVNTINIDMEEFDETGYVLEVFGLDKANANDKECDVMVLKPKCSSDEENSIGDFLDKEQYGYDKLNIHIDVVGGAFYVEEVGGNVIRELELNNSSDREENYVNILKRLKEII